MFDKFWGADVAAQVVKDYGRPRLITATNVFAHVDDVRGFVSAAKSCLHESGALLLEFPYGVVLPLIAHLHRLPPRLSQQYGTTARE